MSKANPAAEHVGAEEPALAGRVDRRLERAPRPRVLAAQVDPPVLAPGGEGGDRHRLDHGERVALDQHPVLEGAGLGLVGVAHEMVRVRRLAGHGLPLAAGREGGAAAADEPGVGDRLGSPRPGRWRTPAAAPRSRRRRGSRRAWRIDAPTRAEAIAARRRRPTLRAGAATLRRRRRRRRRRSAGPGRRPRSRARPAPARTRRGRATAMRAGGQVVARSARRRPGRRGRRTRAPGAAGARRREQGVEGGHAVDSAGATSSRSAMWLIAPRLIQPTRSLTACSAASSRCRRASRRADVQADRIARRPGRRPRTESTAARSSSVGASAGDLQVHRGALADERLSIRTAVALNSAVPDFGSVASIVSRLVSTSSGKCIVMNTRPGRSPASIARRRLDRTPARRRPGPPRRRRRRARSASSGDRSIVSPPPVRAAVPAGLHAGVVGVEAATGGEPQRELVVELVDRRVVDDDAERRRPAALGRVVGPQPAVQVATARAGPRCSTATGCRRARSRRAYDIPACIGDRRAQLVPDPLGALVVGAVVPVVAEAARPGRCRMLHVVAGLARRVERLAHALHPALGVGDGAVALAPRRRAGQHDVGELRGLGEEDVLHDEVVEALEQLRRRAAPSASDWAGFSPITYSARRSPRPIASNISVRCQPSRGGTATPHAASNLRRAASSSTSWKPGSLFGQGAHVAAALHVVLPAQRVEPGAVRARRGRTAAPG